MRLNYDCRELLDELYGKREDERIFFKKSFEDNEFKKMLQELVEFGAIKNLLINSYNSNLIDGKDWFKIEFDVMSWKKLDDFGEEKFNEFTTEPYGEEKQKREVKDFIIEKALRLENTKFLICADDFGTYKIEHIAFLKVIDKLGEEGFLKSCGITFNLGGFLGGFEGTIEVLENLENLKKSVGAEEKKEIKKQGKETKEVSVQPLPKFRFNQGVLFRDFCDEVLMVKGENTQEYRVLQTAINLPIKERIDAATRNIDMGWRQLYDTARRLDDKIKGTFKVDSFFQIDFPNKNITRTVE